MFNNRNQTPKTCNTLSNRSDNESTKIAEQNSGTALFYRNRHFPVSVVYSKEEKMQQTFNRQKLAGRLCRRQGLNKTRSKRSFKVHTKYHANTNRIRKTIQRTINYLSKKKHLHTVNLSC